MPKIPKEKLQPPRGMRDFMPQDMYQRLFIQDTIRQVYQNYGFEPFEVPVLEHYEVLTAKCGEDTLKQMYEFTDRGNRKLGMRYDLTVSTGRVIAMNPSLPKPFKRFYISRAWRYENPQMGRYREFWQADVDTYGVKKMTAETELLATAITALKTLGFNRFQIRMNNRKILSALMEVIGVPVSKLDAVFRIIDKLDKLSKAQIQNQLKVHLDDSTINFILELMEIKGPALEILEDTKKRLGTHTLGMEGINELEAIYRNAVAIEIADHIIVDLSLVRGLDYYTGPIFEVALAEHEDLGSLAGGGRYDTLIEVLGGSPTPAVGISLGIERIWTAMQRNDMFKDLVSHPKVFIHSVSESTFTYGLTIAQLLRTHNISVEIDLMGRKLKKNLQIVNTRGIPVLIIIGDQELKDDTVSLRNMHTHQQETISRNNLVQWFNKH